MRQWLISNGFQGLKNQTIPEMSDDYVNGVSERYIELFEKITGEKFIKENLVNIENRINKNVTDYLNL